MTNRTRTLCALAAVAAVALLLGGCESDTLTSTTDQQAQASLEESAPIALEGLPASDAVETLTEELLGQLGSAGARSSGPAAAGPRTPACESTFDLGNGITGTCAVSQSGTVTITFTGTRTIGGVATTIDGILTVTEAADQPTLGTKYTVALSATATSSRGVAAWYVTGYAVVAEGELIDFALTLSLTVTPTGGMPRTVTISLTPAMKTVFFQTTSGLNVSYILNRSTMTGVVSVQGRQVATVAFSGDCVTIRFVNPAIDDTTICRED